MNKQIFSVLCSMILAFPVLSMRAIAGDSACNNLKTMMHRQKQIYTHYKKLTDKAKLGIKQAKVHITADKKLIHADQKKVLRLIDRLSTQEQYLAHVKAGLARQQLRVKLASQYVTPVSHANLVNQGQLMTMLNDQYRNMCFAKNTEDPAASPLAKQFYP